jgi:hypothetical protein
MIGEGAGVSIRPVRVAILVVFACSLAQSEQFAVFPERKELRSPNGKFVIRSVDHVSQAHELSGLFRALILQNTADGSTRELYHYVSRVGVAWSGNNFIIVTDYVNKKTARALVFRIDRPDEYLVLDKTNLAARIPDERRIQLERNDHAFLEVSRMEGSMLTLRVWGYGAHDPQGFRFQCAYELDQGTTTCRDMVAAGAKP